MSDVLNSATKLSDSIFTLDDIRRTASRFAVIYLWAHVPLIAFLGFWFDHDLLAMTAIVALGAAATTLDWRRNPVGQSVQLTAAAAMAITVAVIVFAFKEHPWQIDMHMYFFAAFALTAVFCNWKPVVLYAAIVAVHHLVLNFALPQFVFPDGGDFFRVVLHAVVVIVQAAALIWLVVVLEKAFASATASLTEAEDAKQEAARTNEKRIKSEQAMQETQKQQLQKIADSFDKEVNSAVSNLANSMQEAQGLINNALQLNHRTSENTVAVASNSEQMSQNVETVMSASEELAVTTAEISRSVSDSTRLAREALSESTAAAEKGRMLSERSRRIEEIVELISNIAEQTNLLALNATIEAARAGEAGKGFAVVANEVKSLAHQTGKATEEVNREIGGIVGSIGEVADAMTKVTEKNEEMSEVFSNVAAAVEEQSAATQEIARIIEQAAGSTNQVTETIGSVRDDTMASKEAMDNVYDISGRLQDIASTVGDRSEEFLKAIRRT